MFNREPTAIDFRFAALSWEVNRIHDSLTDEEKEFLLDVYVTYPRYVRGQPGSEEKMIEYLDAIDVYERVEEDQIVHPFDTRQELVMFAVGDDKPAHILGQPIAQTVSRQELERTMRDMTDQILARFGNIPDETAIRQSERERLLGQIERVFGPGGLEKFVRETSEQHIKMAHIGRAAISGMVELHRNIIAPSKEYLQKDINFDKLFRDAAKAKDVKEVEEAAEREEKEEGAEDEDVSEEEESEEEPSDEDEEPSTPKRNAKRQAELDQERRKQALARQQLLGTRGDLQDQMLMERPEEGQAIKLEENTGQILKDMGREQINTMAEMVETLRKTQGELEALRLVVHEIRSGQKEEIKGINTLVTKTINKESLFDISWSEIPTWFRLQYSKGLLNMCFQLAILPLRIPKFIVSKFIVRPCRRFVQTVWGPVEIAIGFCVFMLVIGGVMHVYYSDDYQTVRNLLNSAPVEWVKKYSMIGVTYGEKLVGPFMPSVREMTATIQKGFIDLVINPIYELVYLIVGSLQAYMVVGLNRFMATVPVVGRWWSPIDVPWPESAAFKMLAAQIAKLTQG